MIRFNIIRKRVKSDLIPLSDSSFCQRILSKYQKGKRNFLNFPLMIFAKNEHILPQKINVNLLMQFHFHNQRIMSLIIEKEMKGWFSGIKRNFSKFTSRRYLSKTTMDFNKIVFLQYGVFSGIFPAGFKSELTRYEKSTISLDKLLHASLSRNNNISHRKILYDFYQINLTVKNFLLSYRNQVQNLISSLKNWMILSQKKTQEFPSTYWNAPPSILLSGDFLKEDQALNYLSYPAAIYHQKENTLEYCLMIDHKPALISQGNLLLNKPLINASFQIQTLSMNDEIMKNQLSNHFNLNQMNFVNAKSRIRENEQFINQPDSRIHFSDQKDNKMKNHSMIDLKPVLQFQSNLLNNKLLINASFHIQSISIQNEMVKHQLSDYVKKVNIQMGMVRSHRSVKPVLYTFSPKEFFNAQSRIWEIARFINQPDYSINLSDQKENRLEYYLMIDHKPVLSSKSNILNNKSLINASFQIHAPSMQDEKVKKQFSDYAVFYPHAIYNISFAKSIGEYQFSGHHIISIIDPRIIGTRNAGSDFSIEKGNHWDHHSGLFTFTLHNSSSILNRFFNPQMTYKTLSQEGMVNYYLLNSKDQLQDVSNKQKEILSKFQNSDKHPYTQKINILGFPEFPGQNQTQIRSKKNFLNNKTIFSTIENLLKNIYSFNLDTILRNDRIKLLDHQPSILWIKTAIFNKIEGVKTVKIFNDKNFPFLRHNDEKTNILKIEDIITNKFFPKTEDTSLNRYNKNNNISFFVKPIINYYNKNGTDAAGARQLSNSEFLSGSDNFYFQTYQSIDKKIEQIKKIAQEAKDTASKIPEQVHSSKDMNLKRQIDIIRISDQVYQNIERRIRIEKERRGL